MRSMVSSPRRLFRKWLPSSLSARKNTATERLEGGLAAEIWGWTLPLLVGATLGWFCMVMLGLWLTTAGNGVRTATTPVAGETKAAETDRMNMASFLAVNPFRVTPLETQNPVPQETATDGYVPITGSLASALLRWTMPQVGVVLEDQGKQYVIPLRSSFDVYTLEEVTYRYAIFRKGEERFRKELLYASGTGPSANSVPNPIPNANPIHNETQIVASDPEKGTEGVISREIINGLVENPFDELKQVRIRPSDKSPGLEVQWITKDSILNKLGVKKGDVVGSINGIPLKNMVDITNSMSSLITSDRFDVSVMRNGAPMTLKYVVR